VLRARRPSTQGIGLRAGEKHMYAPQTTRLDLNRFIVPTVLTSLGLILTLSTGCSGEATSAGSSVSMTTPPADGTPTDGTGSNGTGTNGTGTDGTGTGSGTTSGTPVGSDTTDLGLSPGGAPVVPIGNECIQQDVMIETVTPTVELLIDRSGSMNAAFGASDRWNTIRNVLINPTDGVVMKMQDKVRFGLTLYTSYLTEADTAATCPNLVEQPIALNNYQMIQTTFMANQVFGQSSTPSAESIAAATSKLEAYQETGPKVLVFATDGDPDTCAAPDSNGDEAPRTASEAAVQAAWTKGIATYVIAVGNDIQGLAHMTNLAKIGQGGDPAATYFQASDPTALVDAFNTIVRGLISCDFSLNGTVLEQNAASGTVKIDGLEVPYGDPNGWILVGESTVRLQGTACDTLKIQVSNVDINFPCGTVTIF
jgi:hypothetical protein